MILLFLATLVGLGASQDCTGYEEHPLVVVSMDGFRADYLERGLTPNIQAFKDGGVSPPYMKASYPTVTFPNHYTIVTGLYPESHGIIANHFHDSSLDAEFDIGTEDSLTAKWWGGEPIWNTVVKQGKLSATFFWPGSDADVENMHPSYYFGYDENVGYPIRIDQVLLWLALPASSRPSWICVYFDEPDHTGHASGPYSDEVNEKLVEVDGIFEQLITGIADLNLTDCVNIILLADHGMADAGPDRLLNLTTYVPDLEDLGVTYSGAFVRVDVNDQYEDETDDIRRNLTCQEPEMRQYSPSGLPKRFHFSNNVRIEDIVLDLNLGYTGNVDSDWYLMGEHGYDNYYQEMQPIFIANGPDFKTAVTVEPFQNIELYNLMCYLVGVDPVPNNGTEGALYNLLSSPPDYPSLVPETPPPTPAFPSDDILSEQQHLSGCPNDDSSPLTLNFTSEEEATLLETHLPWGIPYSGELPADLLLLYHQDHVTGYSQTLKMPLWTSFTIGSDVAAPLATGWSSDVRLTSDNTPTCQDYESLASVNVGMQPLFPNRYSTDPAVTFIASNAVPMNGDLVGRWQYLVETLVLDWAQNTTGTLNVVVGPLFDNDADSHVDDFTSFGAPPTVPSDFFLIATRCLSAADSTSLQDCPAALLDVVAFIYPEVIDISNCMSNASLALEYSAKVNDVTIGTGLTFYPSLPYEDLLRLSLRIHSSLWPLSF